MKKAILLAGCVFFGSVALADDDEQTTRQFEFSDFDQIHIAGVFDMTVEIADEYSIVVDGRKSDVDRVKASVKNGKLKLAMKEKKSKGLFGKRNDRGVDLTVTMPALSALEVSGVVDAEIASIDSDRLEIAISGVGDVDLEGNCGSLEAAVSGVGDLDAEDLKCDSVEVTVSGVGDARVYARESVVATIGGMGEIDVYGEPENVEKSSNMFAEVTIH